MSRRCHLVADNGMNINSEKGVRNEYGKALPSHTHKRRGKNKKQFKNRKIFR